VFNNDYVSPKVEFVELDRDEKLEIELFSIDNFPSQCGLSGFAYQEEEPSEEKFMSRNEFEERFQREIRIHHPGAEFI
jgi:hypothetical protein